MKDRILIDGVWYVKEDTPEVTVLGTKYVGYLAENSSFCFDASKFYKDDGESLYSSITIKVSDKRSGMPNTWKTEEWDNDSFLLRVLNNEPEALDVLRTPVFGETINITNTEDIKFFQAFLRLLKEMGWLEYEKPSN